uniref:Uncharacterized protein n=1 Tax=Peronospora matthiolae TaxID=2874970 RepID=A0AAV1TME6_9STRA
MATASSESNSKRKRKRMSKLPAATTASLSSLPRSFAVDAQLQTLENWHRALTIDMRELRREGSRVRSEVTKVQDAVQVAVEKAARCVVQTHTAVKVSGQVKEETQRQLRAAETRFKVELSQLTTRLMRMETRLSQCTDKSVTEEFLMTQLTELHEHYENELMKVREGRDVVLDTQEQQLKKVVQWHDETMQEVQLLRKMMQSLKDETSRTGQLCGSQDGAVTWQEMQKLRQQVEKMENEKREEQNNTRAELEALTNRVREIERQGVDTISHRVMDRDEVREDGCTSAVGWATPESLDMPRLLKDVVRQEDLVGIQNELRRINHDFQAVGIDIASLAKQISARASQQKHIAETRLKELSTQLFDALDHDSRLHATEITRLKDALFDVQSKHREFDQGMRRLDDAVRHTVAARRDRGQGSDWQYGGSPPSVPLALQPPRSPSVTFRNYRERPSRYEPAQESSSYDITWASRRGRRSRSRSPHRRGRSPHNRSSWGEPQYDSCYSEYESVTSAQDAQSDDHSRYDSQGYNSRGNDGVDYATNPRTLCTDSAQVAYRDTRQDAVERKQESTRPTRRKGRSRKTQEVIVIEDDDDDDYHGDRIAVEREPFATRSEAPLDVLSDEKEVLQPTDVVMITPAVDVGVMAPSASLEGARAETNDRLQQEEDLQMGFLLYFCLGGAPDLNVQWATSFTQLKDDECVELSRVHRFQLRYVFLQIFPVYLTQCLLQAVVLNRQNVPERNNSEASRITCALDACSIRAKYCDIIKQKHLLWAEYLIEHLTKRAHGTDASTFDKLGLSVNPASMSSAANSDDVINEWSRRQERAMHAVARALHCGSFLPAIKCNVDTSASVYLFALMFDVLTVTSECPQFGSFRLNGFGSELMAHLWDHTLKKLPYMFFADWSWLDDQLTTKKMPVLAFCHVLASILLWNSAIDGHSLTNLNIYAAAVKHVLSRLCVKGEPVDKSAADRDSSLLQLAEWESSRIELVDLDSKFASMLGLDGFFEVTEAIQNNKLAAARVPRSN